MAYLNASPADSRTPSAGPRPDKGKMDDTELQSVVNGLVAAAVQYVDGELSPERATATNYYMARPFGNEEQGRSQIVLTEVRDGVQAIIPPILRAVAGSERVVEFRPDRKETVPQAEQATDFVNYVFLEDNPGILNTLAVLKDGLVRKTGIFKWGWDDTSEVTQHRMENMTQEQIMLLAQDAEVEITTVEPAGEAPPPAPGGAPIPLFHVELKRTVRDGRARVWAIPPEEFIITRDARTVEEALFVGHRTRKTRGELVAMGISDKDIDEHGGDDPSLQDNEEAIARTVDEIGKGDAPEAGAANDKILYVEGYARIDVDGDGYAELRKVNCIGGAYHVVGTPEPVDLAPFAVFCPDPEPHTWVGLSWADRLMDMQKVKSALLRGGLDSLAASIHPRTAYVEGQVNLADILNTAIGAPIRMKTQGAVQELTHSFTGKEAFPVLQYCDDVVERRTGQSKGAAMMDADALQSSTKSAVTAAVTAAQAQQELLTYIFAETLRKVFAGLLKLLVAHQPRARMIRLRGNFVEVDPRTWDATMDVQINVALGAGLVEEKLATLEQIYTAQAAIMAQAPDNPLVGWVELRNTLAKATELRGWKNSDQFFKQVTQQQLDQAAQAKAQQAPQQSPEMVLAQAQMAIERMKAEAAIARDKAAGERDLLKAKTELELKRREIMLEDDRQRDKQASDAVVALRKIAADSGVPQDDAIAEIQKMRDSAQRGPDEMAPRVKRVKVERDHTGRLVGATVHHEEDI